MMCRGFFRSHGLFFAIPRNLPRKFIRNNVCEYEVSMSAYYHCQPNGNVVKAFIVWITLFTVV